MDNKLLATICSMDPAELHDYLIDELIEKDYEDIDDMYGGYIYAKGNIPFMLVAHLDTVHRFLPREIFYDSEKTVMWSPDGIGGDDRAGVYGILKVLEHCKPHVLFLHEEEVGGVGASYAARYLQKPEVNFMIEFDRRGRDEAVFYDCGNQDFKDHILKFGFKEDWGSFSDISVLSPEWDIASVNLSIGYYNAHSNTEYINLQYVHETIDKTIEILNQSDPTIFYDFQEIVYNYKYPTQQTTLRQPMTMEEFKEIFGRDCEGWWEEEGDGAYFDYLEKNLDENNEDKKDDEKL